MQIHKTLGLVLRVVKYGDSSLIATVYTEVFGLQSYILKGIRKGITKKAQSKAGYFLPGAILEMEVYHNPSRTVQLVKEFQWHFIPQNIFSSVVHHAIASYIVELVEHCIQQPESNRDLFEFITNILKELDRMAISKIGNIPLWFTLHFANALGFQIQGTYNISTPYIDLEEGIFTTHKPNTIYFIEGVEAELISKIGNITNIAEVSSHPLSKLNRRGLIKQLLQFIALHITSFKEIKTLKVLQEVL